LVCLEVIRARGHPNIRALHKTTMELTREHTLTLRGDCIIGVSANKAPVDFNEEFKNCIRQDNAILIVVVKTPSQQEIILAHGDSHLMLTSDTRIILRKSTHIDPGTIGVKANKAASDLKRNLVEELKNPLTTIIVELYCLGLDEITSIYKHSGRVL